MSKRVYLVSCSGRPNYGDELITATWLSFLYKNYPQYEVWLDTPEPGNVQSLFMKYHPNFKAINTLWKICWRSVDILNDINNKTASLIKDYGSPDIDLNIDILRSADIVHILGGGYINANWKENYAILFACQALKQVSQAKTIATGISIYPHEEFLAAEIFNDAITSFDYFSVRDPATASRFAVENTQDDVFLGYDLDVVSKNNSPDLPDILCCIQNELSEDDIFQKLVSLVADYLQQQHKCGKKIGYIEAIPGADNTAFVELQKAIPDIQFYPFSHVCHGGIPVQADGEIISTRFHHHLVGACLGIKGTALNIDREYYKNKHESLSLLGTGWNVQSAETLAGNLHSTINDDFQTQLSKIASSKLNKALALYQE
ncbi:polysaccharide pyruvyl transferase family protein [Klebsiella aerogenes]|uniref:polysaccharide pyruvyl transferase family protein n=1 Tax=Klebsiella aerogenes TaxID=548 RepID=UPI00280E3C93|nr:polysaccharide pyruvyl transferase family protein [Klebsiella aerogenes]MDQ8574126.1 polysaccharide pyruvyl transferase family protein [Klebsiella aerogenes]MDQ8598645.1 polysaccharide pyruvyl transferase family protein [Klebsiella aerogenes]